MHEAVVGEGYDCECEQSKETKGHSCVWAWKEQELEKGRIEKQNAFMGIEIAMLITGNAWRSRSSRTLTVIEQCKEIISSETNTH